MRIEKGDKETVIYIEGRIDISTSTGFKSKVLSLIEEGEKIICLDFTDVTGVDSSGLGKLLLFQKQLAEKDGKLRIRNVKSEYVRKIFSLVHLYKIIDIEDFS